MQEQMSHSQEGSGRFLAARRQSTEHTDEERGQVAGSRRRELSVQFGDSGESDEDPDPPEDPLLNSLPELSVLERLGLHRVALTEQDVEAAFTHLALAFRCDMFTLRRRVQVEERARDVAEENIQQELEECRAALQRLGLSCVDPKRKELVRQLQQSLTVLAGSVERAMSAAEKLGAVHQEARMSRAAEVMVQHVENLKRHHLREHTELEEMKRLIQQNSRNRQLAENRDDGEQRLKLPLMRSFQQASSRRRVSIAVIPKQLTLFPSPESGRTPEGEAAKAAWESSPSTERETSCFQEDSTDGYFILRSDSSNSLHQSHPQADRTECEGDRGCYADGSERELWRRGSTSKPMKEEPDGASDSSGLTEELQQLRLSSPAPAKEIPWPWVFLPQHYWLFLWLLFLGLTCLVLMRILELQKQQPAPPPNS
ncbi:inositol 1,4,5-triphosphate receptor associated 1-like isoform X1 [Gopherus flavomarginatus]|uniref:inositol 1,4,5-triphosphate receptor associated 1-like isoform X1 n=1 Tax=Gopherus flavomarginatus TaxID=286002 RepID=UPI0021CC4755|nr:inositol 1,4,5-triphosphate receptor associated 1-like isoform X1 [Gopherus flavomarginatus]XP_050809013.1 inositol 1,4,5-triphosphate receptor associated 1-like isoform X1 [Gopherus flavomarginatus]XP_050809014.1 inositol 1,4,5-triphosphate receptor associated 1-like isoform X1 [Gopherus flavomarginatus]XP_050809015.1 inositol 1,4,5-triphosphate receptor associated 1-like isoform X1 [Gopherus flavomarginatus]XP_050809016.1 inositol 1,4,5-triphosphate receptor associated 1-like isoform X1 [G